jgi:hypothetical protein
MRETRSLRRLGGTVRRYAVGDMGTEGANLPFPFALPVRFLVKL